ncbi:MAG: hypothetical protein AAF630_13860 [Cyanobacteria bacterium P01_C01_bin.38]
MKTSTRRLGHTGKRFKANYANTDFSAYQPLMRTYNGQGLITLIQFIPTSKRFIVALDTTQLLK